MLLLIFVIDVDMLSIIVNLLLDNGELKHVDDDDKDDFVADGDDEEDLLVTDWGFWFFLVFIPVASSSPKKLDCCSTGLDVSW